MKPRLDREKVVSDLRDRLSGEDFEHVLRVESHIRKLAVRYGLDPEKAAFAGLLHDWARGLPGDELFRLAGELGVPVSPVDRAYPYLLHAPVGAGMLRRDLEIEDPELTEAVGKHTFGGERMSRLDKLLYLADLIEPGRPYPGLEPVREAAERDLDAAYALAYAHKLEHVIRNRRPLHPLSVLAWNRICGIEEV